MAAKKGRKRKGGEGRGLNVKEHKLLREEEGQREFPATPVMFT